MLYHLSYRKTCFYRWFVQPTHLCVAHSELHNVLEVFNSFHVVHVVWWDGMWGGGGVLVSGARVVDEVSEGGEVIGIEGSHSLGEKLLNSLAERALMLQYRLPDGKSWKRLWEGWVGSFTILVALLEHRASKVSRMGGERGTDDLCSCVHCPLEGLSVCCTAVPIPDSDAAGQHTLDCSPVECGEDGWRETCSF